MKVLIIIAAAVCLAGCATTTTVDRSLLDCAPQPLSPAEDTAATQVNGGLYVIDLAAAGDDCRTKLGSVRRILYPETN